MTDGWERIKPQWVRQVDGYQVYSDGRYRVAYEDARGKAVIAAEHLMGAVELDPTRMAWETPEGATTPLAADDRALILQRIVEGLDFMGSPALVTPE